MGKIHSPTLETLKNNQPFPDGTSRVRTAPNGPSAREGGVFGAKKLKKKIK